MKSIHAKSGDVIIYQVSGNECPLAKRIVELETFHKKVFSPLGIKGVVLGKEVEITVVKQEG